MVAAELQPEDWPVLRWIAEAGPVGRNVNCDHSPGDPATEARARLVAAGLAWKAGGEVSAHCRHVVAGLGLIALSRREGGA
jgi:hypothetical protein